MKGAVLWKTTQATIRKYEKSGIVHANEDKRYFRDFYRGSKESYFSLCTDCKNVIGMYSKYYSGRQTISGGICGDCQKELSDKMYAERIHNKRYKCDSERCLQNRLEEMEIESIIKQRISITVDNTYSKTRSFNKKTYKAHESKSTVPTKTKKAKESYIYIMEDRGIYKIGKADNVNKRLKQMETGNPYIKIHYYGKVKDWIGSEKHLHNLFKCKNVKGEWFNLDSYDVSMAVQYIKHGGC